MTVVMIGAAFVDIAYRMDRLPRPGETMLAHGRTVDAGGKGLNQALIAHRAGAEVRLCAALGNDAGAAVLRARIEAEGLPAAWLVPVPCASDESIILVDGRGENCIVSTADAVAHLTPADIERPLTGLAAGDVVCLQGNLSRALTDLCLNRARAAGATTILNPAPIAFDYAGLWPLVDLAVVNVGEALALAGEGEVAAAAAGLRRRGAGRVVVTLGSEGALVLAAGAPVRVPAPAVAALDATGAGDVLVGVLAAGVARGLGLTTAVRWAVAAASLKVTRRGTTRAFPTPGELAALAPPQVS